MWIWLTILSCASPKPDAETTSDEATTVPWSGGLVATVDDLPAQRGWQVRRGIVHLHSPWSHDACDGDPLPDGSPDLDCLQDLRRALCETRMDFAYLTDHPAHAADQEYLDLFHSQDGDTPIHEAGTQTGNRIHCDDGHSVLWMPGIEDTLMPVGLKAHAGSTPEDSHAIYDDDSASAVQSLKDAGGVVLVAHTEGKDLEVLSDMVDAGVEGLELFNLHAAFDPTKREEDLGLDGLGWLPEITPFTSPDGSAEPDLFVLAVLQEQSVSLERWDTLSATTSVIGVAGTDAHQNVLPMDLRDGERGDSYRRMLRWFSNNLLINEDITQPRPEDTNEALSAGRSYVAFEILGTPSGFDLYLEGSDGQTYEMGADTPPGTLHLVCPTLSASSPRGEQAPEFTATIFKDGVAWKTGCGDFTTDGPGVYRARVDILPNHLTDFLGEDPDTWLHFYPWVYSNPFRVAPASEGE